MSDNFNLFKSIFDSFTGLPKYSLVPEPLSIAVSSFLQVEENQITFHSEKYPVILDVLNKNLNPLKLVRKEDMDAFSNLRSNVSKSQSMNQILLCTFKEIDSICVSQGVKY